MFPTLNDLKSERPEDWPGLFLMAATVFLEAEGEGFLGRLAGAYVIWNRAKYPDRIDDVILDPWDFSCWNLDYRKQAIARLSGPKGLVWTDCWLATIGAVVGSKIDPTAGATHYLNEELTRKIRGGSLPGWVEAMTKTAEIGAHTFFKETVKA
jgi:spore germination cell wall hydrolase CwlJ-like protein